jgi:hypothetical protein
MVYKDFLNAARKHEYTCRILLEKLENINENTEKSNFRFLLLNLYYLTGYIIECMVKYGIYNLIGFSRLADIKTLDQKDLRFRDHICHHKFERYTEHLNQRIGISLPLVSYKAGIHKEVVKLYKNWGSEIRYSSELMVTEKRHYISFYQNANKILEDIRNNVRG